MWKTLSDWLLALLNMTRELEENRASTRRIEARLRDMEEAIKLPAQEQRHAHELESAEDDRKIFDRNIRVSAFCPEFPVGNIALRARGIKCIAIFFNHRPPLRPVLPNCEHVFTIELKGVRTGSLAIRYGGSNLTLLSNEGRRTL